MCARVTCDVCGRPHGRAAGSTWKKRSTGFPWNSAAPVTSDTAA